MGKTYAQDRLHRHWLNRDCRNFVTDNDPAMRSPGNAGGHARVVVARIEAVIAGGDGVAVAPRRYAGAPECE